MSNAIGIVVSGNRAVDENAVVDSVVVVVGGGFVVVEIVDVVGIVVVVVVVCVVVVGFLVDVVVDLVGTFEVDVVVGCFDVVVIITVGFVGAADVDDSFIGFAVVGFGIVAELGLSNWTVVYVTFTLEFEVGVCVSTEIGAELVDDGVIGLGFVAVVDECIGVVYSLLLVDDARLCVTFNFEIVVPYDGFFVSAISLIVVSSNRSVCCVRLSSVVENKSSSKMVGIVSVVVVREALFIVDDVPAVDAILFGANDDTVEVVILFGFVAAADDIDVGLVIGLRVGNRVVGSEIGNYFFF